MKKLYELFIDFLYLPTTKEATPLNIYFFAVVFLAVLVSLVNTLSMFI